jgi:hypothetical protein
VACEIGRLIEAAHPAPAVMERDGNRDVRAVEDILTVLPYPSPKLNRQ